MSDLPKCLLCGRPAYRKPDSVMICCKNMGCEMTLVDLTEQQWAALMGRGEPVAIAKTRREFHEYENSALEDEVGYLVTHVNWVKKPQDVGELKLYTQAPAVDDTGFGGQPLVYDDEQTALNKLERFLKYVHLTIDSMDSARVTLSEIHCEARELMKELNLKGEG